MELTTATMASARSSAANIKTMADTMTTIVPRESITTSQNAPRTLTWPKISGGLLRAWPVIVVFVLVGSFEKHVEWLVNHMVPSFVKTIVQTRLQPTAS